MNKIMKFLTLSAVLASSLLLSGCDPEEGTIGKFLYEETGGEYTVADQFGNEQVFTLTQARYIDQLDDGTAEAYLSAKFESSFPDSYLPGVELEITEQTAEPIIYKTKPQIEAIARIPATVLPGGLGEVITYTVLGLLGLGGTASTLVVAKKSNRRINTLNTDVGRKKVALDLAGRLIDGAYTAAEMLPDQKAGQRITLAIDKGRQLVTGVAGAAEELEAAITRTETPVINPGAYLPVEVE